MLRFDPGEERIATTRATSACGRAAASTTSRAACGAASACAPAIVTALADNPVGRLVEDLMLQGGVDLSHVRWVPFDGIGREARNGIYFLERGFGVRGAHGHDGSRPHADLAAQAWRRGLGRALRAARACAGSTPAA